MTNELKRKIHTAVHNGMYWIRLIKNVRRHRIKIKMCLFLSMLLFLSVIFYSFYQYKSTDGNTKLIFFIVTLLTT